MTKGVLFDFFYVNSLKKKKHYSEGIFKTSQRPLTVFIGTKKEQ